MEFEDSIDRQTLVLLKLLDAMKDMVTLAEAIIDEPDEVQKRILRRKLKILSERLPKTSGEIKTIVKRKETKQLNFSNLTEKTKVTF